MGVRSWFGLFADGPGKRMRTSVITDENGAPVHIPANSVADPDSTAIANVKASGATASSADSALVVTLREGVTVNATGLTIPASVTVGSSALPANAAQETGGNLAAVLAAVGAVGDAAYSGSGSSTLVAALKALYGLLSATAPVAPAATSALASSLVLKASAGNLLSLVCETGGVSGYLMLFDATSAPVDGAVSPKWVSPVYANAGGSWAWPAPLAFSNGVVAVFSSTGPFIKTASATAFMAGQVR
jgi:hypothetical protein